MKPYDDTHYHRLPRSLLPMVLVCVLGLVVSVCVVFVQAHATAVQAARTDARLAALEDYVAGKGRERDTENQQMQQQMDALLCNILDQLPPDPVLDPVRQAHQCGPGLIPTP